MPRPRKCRLVGERPKAIYFKPQGVPLAQLREVVLPVEALEALRLTEVEGLEQDAAAQSMGISRPTLSRILAEARRKISLALVNGWALRIEGGDYELVNDKELTLPTGGPRGRRRGGRGRGPGL